MDGQPHTEEVTSKMLRSMFSGVSGLRAHQTMMDVVGNNVANVNTPGYKASQVTFQEALTQTVRAASPGAGVTGGTNPIQVGLGAQVSTVEGIFTQGTMQVTGRTTDVAIQGEGYFVLGRGGERLYSRAGSLGFDHSGALVNGNGLAVMGWNADAAGVVDTTGPLQAITVPIAQVIAPVATTRVEVGGNLSADAEIGTTVLTTTTIYDSLGVGHEMVLSFENVGGGDWDMTVEIDGTSATVAPATVSFDSDGSLTSASPLTISGYTPPGADAMAIDVVIDGDGPLVQFGGASSPEAHGGNGQAIGFLQGVSIGADGTVMAVFSNGLRQPAAVIATATFANPGGLSRIGESSFGASANSGDAVIGRPGDAGRGLLTPGALEMSNVDLAREFTNLIIAQRGFQANSRIISASDELLADLVNLRR